ncbi:sensor histidine kinase [Actinorugispora endophytica]|uniref:sensor histidine kinase n=1 Tax=Actinorugispora endophytica TaxID=1605990 RepID=UPI001FB7B8B9|nr:histidine kinase [Actinorugispora endophytica]
MRLAWLKPLDREVLGGWSRLGSLLWALAHLALGVPLLMAGAYVHRPGVEPIWLMGGLALVCAGVTLRRTLPGTGLVVGTLGLAVDTVLLGPTSAAFITYGDLLYAVAVWGRGRIAYGVFALVAVLGVVVCVVGGYLLYTGALSGGMLNLMQLAGLYVLVFVTPMTTGLSVREHRSRAELERERAHQIIRMAELDRGSAVAEERGRMARELHDVIANHLSAVAVQSTAALSMREFDAERVRDVLRVVRDSSVQGLAEMRRMIGVLRADDHPELERVTPRLREVERLVDGARAAGLEVAADGVAEVGELPAQVDAAAYRIVQECLTNALRYAEPRRVRIAARCLPVGADGAGTLVIEVENPVEPRRVAADGEGLGAGWGLTGMRERVGLLGGVLDAGPDGAGRWRVRAELPLERSRTEEGTTA